MPARPGAAPPLTSAPRWASPRLLATPCPTAGRTDGGAPGRGRGVCGGVGGEGWPRPGQPCPLSPPRGAGSAVEGARRQPRGAESERPEPSSARSAGMAAGGCPGRPLPPLPLLLLLPVLLALLRPGRAAAAEVSAGVGSALGAARRERGRASGLARLPQPRRALGCRRPVGAGWAPSPPGCAPAARLLRSLLEHRAAQRGADTGQTLYRLSETTISNNVSCKILRLFPCLVLCPGADQAPHPSCSSLALCD